MEKILQYAVIEAENASELERKVAEHIDDGWYPFGGVSLSVDESGNCIWYAQAMVEYSE